MEVSEQVLLSNLGAGAAAEMFEAELAKVVKNIADPNTNSTATRSITLKVVLKPNKDRNLCQVNIQCDAKVAAAAPFQTAMFVGVERGKAVASEYNPKQGSLFGEPGKVLSIQK